MIHYPHIDRSPCIVAAGKLFGDSKEKIEDAFFKVTLEDKIDAVKRELGLIDSKKLKQDISKSTDSDTLGAFTEIRHCIRPVLPSAIEALNDELKNSIYDSFWNKPVGKTRDQTPGLPQGTKPLETTYGSPPGPKDAGGSVINPRKKAEQVQLEDELTHELYKYTHQNYYSGERIKRNYSLPFNEYNFFGKPSKKEENGERVKRCLTWFNNDPLSNVSRRQAAVRNRTLPAIGKGLDKTGVTDLHPEDHTYGKPSLGNLHGVEDLLNESPPSLLRRDMQIFLTYMNSLRHRISEKISTGEIDLEEIFEEITNLNKGDKEEDSKCTVHFDCIERIMRRHRIYLDRSKLEPLFLMVGILSENGFIKVADFINSIDKNISFPKLKREHYVLPPEFQKFNCEQQLENVKDLFAIASMPPAGRPSLPVHGRVCTDTLINKDHLSQETVMRTLISPSIFTQYGLSHRDFLKPRDKQTLGTLFRKIGVTLTDEELEEIYEEGYNKDQTGGVCVETFRNILDERAYKAYNRL